MSEGVASSTAPRAALEPLILLLIVTGLYATSFLLPGQMTEAQTNLAAAALVISLVALATTLAQLLQQYFATAEGFRRCQDSIIGPWAKYTRLQWRFSEFRFETLFTVPVIQMRDNADAGDLWLGNDASKIQPRRRSAVNKRELGDELEPRDESASWLLFLQSLEDQNLKTLRAVVPEAYQATLSAKIDSPPQESKLKWSSVLRASKPSAEDPERVLSHMEKDRVRTSPGILGLPPRSCSVPKITHRERSWDFMPAEVIRPLAITNISDIGILARRLGMKWIDFRPSDGVMKAEGCGHVFTSTFSRSVGIILQYLHTGGEHSGLIVDETLKLSLINEDDGQELYIPRSEVDRMGFGILPGCKSLDIPDFHVANAEDAFITMRRLKCSATAQDRLKRITSDNAAWIPGFSDIIAMAAPVLRFRGSQVIQVPAPSIYHVGLTYEREGFKIFHYRLQQYIGKRHDVSEQTKWVLQQYEHLRDQYPSWENEHIANQTINHRSLTFLEEVHDRWNDTTRYFQEIQNSNRFSYRDLVACHIEHTAGWICRDEMKTGQREYFDLISWIAEGMHIYFELLPDMVEYMRGKGVGDGDLVREAWFTLMFRAFCWHRLHFMVKGPTIPGRHYGSRMPVYIG